MAGAAIEFLMDKLKQQLIRHAHLIPHYDEVDKQFRHSKTLIRVIPKQPRHNEEQLWELIRRIRDAVYVAEDAIDAYVTRNELFQEPPNIATIVEETVYTIQNIQKMMTYLAYDTELLQDGGTTTEGCLGALDGTYISVKVPIADRPRYRNRKGDVSTNTLAVCDRNLRFIFVMPGWEGSAADSRVLRDAMNKPNGFRVPRGCYYLADGGYANCEGFLTPYRSVRYHLSEWGPANTQPANEREIFNMRHSKARNVIERAFGVMKMRWGILRSASFYPIKVQIYMISACFLLHNFIRTNMDHDPMEDALDETTELNAEMDQEEDGQFINIVQTSNEWSAFRDEIANYMWNARLDELH